ncbi:SPFH domain-containing protein [Gordonia phthalatica]|uniref:Virion core protein (Lumpy skin disease virus) n=1 Tax=Gordonia phthalatica TaxID=1136941 RepID=A0A0N9NK72_9ACTN|nr:SPFH domain-containing protein [Gordonia phthalatica]ALG86404.1 hypothetical protein ACH46_20290 [Gordonia phthalatica]
MRVFDVIQNERGAGDNSVVAWKFDGEDFFDRSQLIVNESEEAVFFQDGLAMEVFQGGRYTLDTRNHPFLTKLRSKLSSGKNVFTSQVYFVNKVHRLEMKWGTDSPIQVRDPIMRVPTKVTARGSYSLQIVDAKRFLIKLVGNVRQMTDQELNSYYRSAFSQYIKDAIADHLMNANEEILNVANKKAQLAGGIKETLMPLLDDYGVEMVDFYIAAIDIPDDTYRAQFEQNELDIAMKVKHGVADSQVKIQTALGDKGAMDVLGADWGRLQSAEILRDLANNPGAGGIASTGAGIGFGMAASGVFDDMARNLIVPPSQPASQQSAPEPPAASVPTDFMPAAPTAPPSGSISCGNCGAGQPAEAKFCSECGTRLAASCPGCGAGAAPGAKFCGECGTRIGGM